MRIPFTKMHGLGNDFMVISQINQEFSLSADQIRQLADRHFGIGFDQLLLISPPSNPDVDFDYRIFNADGNEVEHCGNGARCFAVYVRDKGLSDKNPIRVRTINSDISLQINKNGEVTVDMGVPKFSPEAIPFTTNIQSLVYSRVLSDENGTIEVEFSSLSVGNPHAILIVENVDTAPIERVGRLLGRHRDFRNGVNVGFMQIVDKNRIRLRVFERGVGETQACGTGACAAVVAGCSRGLLNDTVEASLSGGKLILNWRGVGHPVLMTGPASTVFEGSIEL